MSRGLRILLIVDADVGEGQTGPRRPLVIILRQSEESSDL